MPLPAMNSVFSSHIDSVGYDEEGLVVLWNTGRYSRYSGVPQEVAEKVMSSWSVGEALNSMVKGRYDHEYIGGGE